MRTSERARSAKTESPLTIRADRAARNDILAIIVDIDNGHEFYMSIIDSFQIENREYVVMYPFEPDDGEHKTPEITILRVRRHVDGEQYYQSIKDRRELDVAFEMFFSRFEASGAI